VSLLVKEFWKSVNIWWSYWQEYSGLFFGLRCTYVSGVTGLLIPPPVGSAIVKCVHKKHTCSSYWLCVICGLLLPVEHKPHIPLVFSYLHLVLVPPFPSTCIWSLLTLFLCFGRLFWPLLAKDIQLQHEVSINSFNYSYTRLASQSLRRRPKSGTFVYAKPVSHWSIMCKVMD